MAAAFVCPSSSGLAERQAASRSARAVSELSWLWCGSGQTATSLFFRL